MRYTEEERDAFEAARLLGAKLCVVCEGFASENEKLDTSGWSADERALYDCDLAFWRLGPHCERCFYEAFYNLDPEATDAGTWVLVSERGAFFEYWTYPTASAFGADDWDDFDDGPDAWRWAHPGVPVFTELWRLARVFTSRHDAVRTLARLERGRGVGVRSAAFVEERWAVVG